MDDSPGVWTAPHALTAAGPGYRRAPTTRPPLSMERPMATNPVSITTKPETTAATESGCGCGGSGCGAAEADTDRAWPAGPRAVQNRSNARYDLVRTFLPRRSALGPTRQDALDRMWL